MSSGKIYYLMHKNIEVAELEISDYGELGRVRVSNVNFNHVPLGAQMNMMKFHEWWKDRATPKTRIGAKNALRKLGYVSTQSMLVNNLALSLNDCYWIKPVSSNLYWEQVSLFRNDFTDIFGQLTFDVNKPLSRQILNTKFNSASSQGELQKKWCIDNTGRRFLVKGNWGSTYQQSLNEVFASLIHYKQDINFYTPYSTIPVEMSKSSGTGIRTGIGCYSYNFCSEQVESISAWEVLQTTKVRQGEYFQKFKEVCINNLGFTEQYFHQFMDYEILTDFLISNTDRHLNNIAVLRNPDTLQFIGFAPIYDSGNSMFFRDEIIPSGSLLSLKTCSFVALEVNLLKNVLNRNCVNIDLLPTYDEFKSIYIQDIPERHPRIDQMYKAYIQKVQYLIEFQHGANLCKIRKPHNI